MGILRTGKTMRVAVITIDFLWRALLDTLFVTYSSTDISCDLLSLPSCERKRGEWGFTISGMVASGLSFSTDLVIYLFMLDINVELDIFLVPFRVLHLIFDLS
jgi:hypothetical protein